MTEGRTATGVCGLSEEREEGKAQTGLVFRHDWPRGQHPCRAAHISGECNLKEKWKSDATCMLPHRNKAHRISTKRSDIPSSSIKLRIVTLCQSIYDVRREHVQDMVNEAHAAQESRATILYVLIQILGSFSLPHSLLHQLTLPILKPPP